MDILSKLFELQDIKYRDFHAALVPNVDKQIIIGVRMPALRALAKELDSSSTAEFLSALPHRYYDENALHGILISSMRDYVQADAALDEFLPNVDNWAVCDLIKPKAFRSRPPELEEKTLLRLGSAHCYTRRFAMETLMTFYLDDGFRPEFPELVAGSNNDEYYIKMMTAWYFATALAKQWDAVIPLIENRRLEPWTHRKAIQKSIESFRITPEQKEYLRSLK